MFEHILISRTDAIGDVVLTLPMCGILKHKYPNCTISFLGNSYTRDVITASEHVDNFIDVNEWNKSGKKKLLEILKALKVDTVVHVFPKNTIAHLAVDAGIKTRIGTRNRIFHWITCNKLISLSRKSSMLHEAQLNLKLLAPLEITKDYSLADLPAFYGFSKTNSLTDEQKDLLSSDKFNLLIHPKSSGSASEWPLENYAKLIKLLDPSKCKIFITGSEKEQALLSDWIKGLDTNVIDITGKYTLKQFIAFIKAADGLIASSTGPLHLAAASGIHCIGLYTKTRSVNAARWAPIGKKAEYIEANGNNIKTISPEAVLKKLSNWSK